MSSTAPAAEQCMPFPVKELAIPGLLRDDMSTIGEPAAWALDKGRGIAQEQ